MVDSQGVDDVQKRQSSCRRRDAKWRWKTPEKQETGSKDEMSKGQVKIYGNPQKHCRGQGEEEECGWWIFHRK